MNIFERTPFRTGFERYEKGKKTPEENKFSDYGKERGEDAGYFNYLKGKLRKMQEGGADIHFGQIDIDALSDKTIDFYRKFEHNNLDEKELDEFTSQLSTGDNDYHFAALLRNWLMEKKNLDVEKEREKLKKEAEKKFNEIKKSVPHISAYVNDKIFNSLRRFDYKITIELDKTNFGDYEGNLREYFKNKTHGKKDESLLIIQEDPRFKYYCALREALGLEGPCRPEIFIK